MSIRTALLLVSLTALLLGNGCASQTPEAVSFDVIFNDNQCGLNSARTRIFANRDTLQRFIAGLSTTSGSQSSLPTVLGRKQPATLITTLEDRVTNHNFDQSQLVLIARGPQPNPGHGIEVRNNRASITNNELILPITFATPDPDQIYAQVVISPCVLLDVKTTTNFDSIALADN